MVGAGEPECFITIHPGVPDQDILKRIVQNVTHGENAGHIGWRNYNNIRFFSGLIIRMKISFSQPVFIPSGFDFLRIIDFV